MTNDQNQYKYPCGLVRDLIPLYRDNVCGEDSRKIVEEHIVECKDCADILEQLDDSFIEEKLSVETNSVLQKHHKKEHRTAVTAGLITSGILIIPVIVCLIVNLASGHGLSWFYIVLTSLMTVASVTVVPMLSAEYRFSKSVGAFTLSVILLLVSCWLCTGGNWLFVAAVPTILGISLFCAPFAVRDTPLPDALKNRKTLIVVLWDVIWLFATLGVCCLYSGGDWFVTAAVACAFGIVVIFMPILIKQIPLPEPLQNHKALIVMIWDTIWLYALLFECSKYAYSAGIDIMDYFHNSIWITSLSLLVPWTMFILIRYTKLQPLVKTGFCILIPALFGLVADDIVMLVFQPHSSTYSPSLLERILDVILHRAEADMSFTVVTIVFSSVIALGILFITAGIIIRLTKHKNKK